MMKIHLNSAMPLKNRDEWPEAKDHIKTLETPIHLTRNLVTQGIIEDIEIKLN